MTAYARRSGCGIRRACGRHVLPEIDDRRSAGRRIHHALGRHRARRLTYPLRSFCAASSSSRACARPLSDSPSPASMRASSATRSSSSRRRTPLDLLRPAAVDHEVHVGVGGDLRQVGDDDDLVGAGQPGQPPPDLHRGATADPGVDLVEDHRGALGRGRKHDFQRQHDPGQLAAGRALAQRQHVGAPVRGEAELDGVDTVVPGVDRRHPTAG